MFIITTEFFIWFFSGLGGIGGWILFFLISAAAVLYVFIDSGRRKLPAMAWRLGALLLALLVLPAAVYRFLDPATQLTLVQYLELIFYFGIIGGIVPFFVALGYYLHFRGMATCPNGHVYDPAYGACPDCPREPIIFDRGARGGVGTEIVGERETITTQFGNITLPFDTKEKANAFLLLPDGHNYELNKGITNIGRDMKKNDFAFDNHTVGRQHARIRQHEGRKNLFRLADLDSTNGTFLNGRRVRRPRLLYSNDEIRFGPEVKVVFIAKSER